MRKRRRFLPVFVLLCALSFFVTAAVRARIDPLVRALAVATVDDAASNQITDAVNRLIADGNIRYGDLITLEKNDTGAVTALTTNMREMNRLKNRLLSELDQEIYKIDENRISIPLGNLTGTELLSGHGPEIPVRIISVSSSDAAFKGEFTEAGINQTLHRIMLEVSLDLLILLPTGTVQDHVTSDLCVAETVLLGPVPGSYTNLQINEDAGKDAGE